MASSQFRMLQGKVAALAATAAALQVRIFGEEPATSLVDDILTSLKKQVEDFPSKAELPASARRELDTVATELWNACAHTRNACLLNVDEMNAHSMVRAVTCSLISIAASNEASGHIRALKVAFTACRFCFESEQQDLALTILKVGARRLDLLQSIAHPIHPDKINTIAAEYYMLRAHLARIQGRFDIAEHLYSKIPPTGTLGKQYAVIELCYTIGNDASVTSQYETAIEWFEKAVEQLDALTVDQSQEKCFKDLDLQVRHHLVRVYQNAMVPANADKLKKQLNILKSEHGNTEAVLFLEISHICCEKSPDADAFFRVLNRIIGCMSFTEIKFDVIFENIKWSKCLSIGLSMEALLSFLLRVPADMRDWVEKCFIQAVAMAFASKLRDQARIDFIKRTTQSMDARRFSSLGRQASHAALILIWAQVDNACCQNQSYVAEKWCHLVLDAKAFENVSRANRSTIKRKLFAIAMKDSNIAQACHILNQMISECSNHADAFSLLEFEWLCSKSFNLARQFLSRGDAETSRGILSSMHELLRVYKKAPQANLDKYNGLFFIDVFLGMTTHAINARSGTDRVAKSAAYASVLDCSDAVKGYLIRSSDLRLQMDSILEAALGMNHEESMIITLTMQFEAGLFLSDWRTLSDWFVEIPDGMPEILGAKLMHLFLSCDALPRDLKVYYIAYIIRNLYRRTELTTSLRIACPHYLHELFELCITDTVLSEPLPWSSFLVRFCECRGKFERGQVYLILAERVLDQAIRTAEDEAYMNSEVHRAQHQRWNEAHEGDPRYSCNSILYPTEELEYLAIRSFNQAAELYADGRDKDCRRWAKKAIHVSELMDNDEGKTLAETLRARLATLL